MGRNPTLVFFFCDHCRPYHLYTMEISVDPFFCHRLVHGLHDYKHSQTGYPQQDIDAGSRKSVLRTPRNLLHLRICHAGGGTARRRLLPLLQAQTQRGEYKSLDAYDWQSGLHGICFFDDGAAIRCYLGQTCMGHLLELGSERNMGCNNRIQLLALQPSPAPSSSSFCPFFGIANRQFPFPANLLVWGQLPSIR